MGILSRFTSIMKANIFHYRNKEFQADKPMKKIVRELHLDLGTVQSEYNALEANVKRAKQAIIECETEISKLERYKDRVREKDEDKFRFFTMEQDDLEASKSELITDYNRLLIEEKQLKLLEEKLTMDIHALEKETKSIRNKTARLNQQQKINDSKSSITSGFSSYEEELNFKLDEAEALANLRSRARESESIDEELENLYGKLQQNKE